MDKKLQYEVKPVEVRNSAAYHQVDPNWPTDDRTWGYYPGIFGPGWYDDKGYSLQCPALDHLDTSRHDPIDKLFATPEEAMEAWRESETVKMNAMTAMKYYLMLRHVDAINAQGIYRHYNPNSNEVTP